MRLWLCIVLGSIVAGVSAIDDNGVQEPEITPSAAKERTVIDLRHEHVQTNLGETHRFLIEKSPFDTTHGCQVRVPGGTLFPLIAGTDIPGVEILTGFTVSCGIAITILSEEYVGDWTLVATETLFPSIEVEKRLPITIYTEAPDASLEEDREIINLTREDVYIEYGDSSRVILNAEVLGITETCHIRTPDNSFYTLTQNSNLPGVEVIPSDSRVSCGINLSLISENFVGDWVLIAREIKWVNSKVERRLPFRVIHKVASL